MVKGRNSTFSWILGILFGGVKQLRRFVLLQPQENADCQVKIAVQVLFGLKKLLAIKIGINTMQQDQIIFDLVFGLCGKNVHAPTSKQENIEGKRREKVNHLQHPRDYFVLFPVKLLLWGAR